MATMDRSESVADHASRTRAATSGHGASLPEAHHPGLVHAWSVASRPRSLPVAIAPVIVGTALAASRGGLDDPRVMLLVLAAAVLVQLACNLQNDVGFTARGGEHGGTRTGLPRASAQGWLSPRALRAAVLACSALAAAAGFALAAMRGWPVLAIGAASLGAGLAYMGGPRPIAYTPLGEATVFVFFGLVAVVGTDWVLAGSVGPATPAAAALIGGLAAAALAANNHRDAAHDARIGRRTFATVFGERASRRLYAVLLVAPFALVPVVAWQLGSAWPLVALAWLPSALALRRAFAASAPGSALNAIVQRTFSLELRVAMTLAIGVTLEQLAR
jgi:1,4-dihydroxy-2-naphthoate octaprenyltransferase